MHVLRGDIAKRQGLVGGLVSDVIGGGDSGQQSTSPTQDSKGPIGSLVGGLTSNVVGGLTSGLAPILSTPSGSTSSFPSPTVALTSSSSSFSSTASAITSQTSSSAVTSSSSSSSISSSSVVSLSVSVPSTSSSSAVSTTSSSSSISTPLPSNPQQSDLVTSSGDALVTMTSFVNAPSSSSSSTPHPSSSFLANKPLAGGVFAVVGIAALAIIVAIVTIVVRKSRRDRELDEALSFAPSADHHSHDEEKAGGVWPRRSSSSSGQGAPGSDSSHGPRMAPMPSIRRDNRYPTGLGYGPPGIMQQSPTAQGYGAPNNNAPYPYMGAGANYGQQGQNTMYPMPPRSPAAVRDPMRSPPPPVPNPAFSGPPVLPQLNIISATPNANGRSLTAADKPLPVVSGFTPGSGEAPPKAHRMSLFRTSPTEGAGASAANRSISHTRELDPAAAAMPVSPVLPDTFGDSEQRRSGEADAYTAVVSDDKKELPRQWKVTN
ncbi:hypothetical protein DENSPDRAFT_20506 [Dentipellis sp. KUC8613]|nr:hypothetical protein DENSPDRAFT_20506 [Dentipellis sp. KUC8613]